MRLRAAVLVTTAVLAAGCGSAEEDPAPRVVATAQVIAGFEQATGDTLVRDYDVDADWDVLFTGHTSPNSLDQKFEDEYGEFSLDVARDAAQADEIWASVTSPFDGDSATLQPDEETADGIVWVEFCEKATDACFWSAHKRFGVNVVVTWQAGHAKTTTAQWDTLTAALEKATGA